MLAQISGAKRIFEMGSAIGYSTIWLARDAGSHARQIRSDFHRREQASVSGGTAQGIASAEIAWLAAHGQHPVVRARHAARERREHTRHSRIQQGGLFL